MRFLFATGNQGKLREVNAILNELGIDVVSMKDAGYDVPIDETGTTFAENSLIKARTVCEASGEVTMADDSGLVIDALGGEPGIYSARYMGEDTSYHIKNNSVFPDGRELVCEETFEGRIGYEERGANGFGYDPIFFVPEKGCYSAELAPEEKNAISHRGKALRAMREKIRKALAE